jgi:predicted GIY-YIG superfamily endonuclease
MANPDTQWEWEGQSGNKYKYEIHPIGRSFNEKSANYIYAKKVSPGEWVPVYIGQTQNLAERIADHEKEACAEQNGATHIHAHASSRSEKDRRAEESDLIGKWDPVCND